MIVEPLEFSLDGPTWAPQVRASSQIARLASVGLRCIGHLQVLKRDKDDWDSRFNLGILLNEIGEARKVHSSPSKGHRMEDLASVW